jgi:hypothetical protein
VKRRQRVSTPSSKRNPKFPSSKFQLGIHDTAPSSKSKLIPSGWPSGVKKHSQIATSD